jgi:hypothetical protein
MTMACLLLPLKPITRPGSLTAPGVSLSTRDIPGYVARGTCDCAVACHPPLWTLALLLVCQIWWTQGGAGSQPPAQTVHGAARGARGDAVGDATQRNVMLQRSVGAHLQGTAAQDAANPRRGAEAVRAADCRHRRLPPSSTRLTGSKGYAASPPRYAALHVAYRSVDPPRHLTRAHTHIHTRAHAVRWAVCTHVCMRHA